MKYYKKLLCDHFYNYKGYSRTGIEELQVITSEELINTLFNLNYAFLLNNLGKRLTLDSLGFFCFPNNKNLGAQLSYEKKVRGYTYKREFFNYVEISEKDYNHLKTTIEVMNIFKEDFAEKDF
jgi:hypothetical protein